MLGHLKTIFFLLLCIGVGAGIGRAYVWFTHPKDGGPDFSNSNAPAIITGVGDAPAHRGFTITAASLPDLAAVLKQSRNTFATTIGLEYSPALAPAAMAAAVRAAHEQHMALALLPPPVFAAQNPFPKPLTDIAAQAQSAGVDVLCVSWLNTQADSDYWRQQCQLVRPIFKGQLILAATPDVLPSVACLDVPDLIGAIGPIPLPRRLPSSPDDVTMHDLRVAWDCALTSLESLARAYSTSNNAKKIALLHMYVPEAVSARLPAAGAPDRPAANPGLQKMLYEALLLETKGRSTYTDVLLFNYDNSPGQKNSPLSIKDLTKTIADAWDPKKPAVVDPASQFNPIPELPELPDFTGEPDGTPDTTTTPG